MNTKPREQLVAEEIVRQEYQIETSEPYIDETIGELVDTVVSMREKYEGDNFYEALNKLYPTIRMDLLTAVIADTDFAYENHKDIIETTL